MGQRNISNGGRPDAAASDAADPNAIGPAGRDNPAGNPDPGAGHTHATVLIKARKEVRRPMVTMTLVSKDSSIMSTKAVWGS